MSFFAELKRRNVFRVVTAYVVMSWLLLQFADVALAVFNISDGVFRLLALLLAIGLIPVAIFSWVFEMTPEGIKKESEVGDGDSITHSTGRRLNYITIGMVIVGIVFVLWQQQREPAGQAREPAPVATIGENSIATPLASQTATPVDSRSIAVLPFVNMSSDPENEYFADGLSEELLNQLAQIPKLQVAGRTSSFSFKGKNEDLRKIGATLGVANVLEGSVRRQGNQVRVTAQVIRVKDGFHLWSNTYDRAMDDVFAIQDDISSNVANALKIVLDEPARKRMQAAGVRNVEAFVEFQKGMEWFELAHGTGELMEDLRTGVVHFDRAIEQVPGFGAAYWHKSDYYAHIILNPASTDEERANALADLRAVLDAAYRYSGDSPRRAFIDVDRVLFSDDWSTLRDRIEKALAAEGCPEPTWIEVATMMGYAEAAGQMFARYQRCEPLSTTAHLQIAWAALWQRDFEKALQINADAQSLLGSTPWYAANRQKILMAMGRADDALALAPEVAVDVAFYGMGSSALPLALSGDKEGARNAMQQWQAENGRNLRNEVEIHAAIGERQRANELAAEIDTHPGGTVRLLLGVDYCACGAPFDLEFTPNFRDRLSELEMDWPPPKIIDYPLKTW